MSVLLTVVEVEDGAIAAESVAALGFAGELAARLGVAVAAVSFGTAEVADAIGELGVPRLRVVEHDLLGEYAPECWGEALAQLLGHLAPVGVLAAATERGNELMAHAAARAGLPLATNCVAVGAGEPWTLTRTRGGGVLLEDAELSASVKLVTVTPAAARRPAAAPVERVEVATFTPVFAPVPAHGRLVERTAAAGGVTLTSARVVVSGGRGVGSAQGFAVLEQLAELVGGAVGCSRVATNNGWRPHSDQVGLTGTRITPELYIACGISGATQHWVGCMDAKRILAINTDPDAPMVTRAAYAVIGDVHQILPAVIDEIRRRASDA
ncbi:electron transfer flavoprotein subunit alpha/FixB family protein [Actinophytocola sediminis]